MKKYFEFVRFSHTVLALAAITVAAVGLLRWRTDAALAYA
jgi:hypothetical protein